MHAGIQIGDHLPFTPPSKLAPLIHGEIPEPYFSVDLEGAMHEQHSVGLLRIECVQKARECRARTVQPKRIAIHHIEWIWPEQIECIGDRSPRVPECFFPTKDRARAVTRALAAETEIARLSVGRISLLHVPTLVTKLGTLNENLLGMSFLDKLGSFTVSGDRLILKGRP